MDMKVLSMVVLLCLVQPLTTRVAVREVEGYLPESKSAETHNTGLTQIPPHHNKLQQQQHKYKQQQKLEQQLKQQQEEELQKQQLQKSKANTVVVVPRSNNIQIAFAASGDDPQTSLHVDLLRLYKEVMEEILQRNKLIQTVQTMFEKVTLVDAMGERLDRLELLCSNMVTEDLSGKHGKGRKGKKGPKGQTGKAHGVDHNNTIDHDQIVSTDGELGDWEMLVREVQRQGKSIWAMKEERKVDHRLTSEMMLLVNQQRDQMAKLTTQISEQAQTEASLRQQTMRHSQILEEHTALLELHQTEMEVVGAKSNKLSMDVQWQSFKINMNENTTESLKRELTDLEAFLGTTASSTAVRGTDMFSMWNRAKSDIERCQTDINTIHKKIRDIEEDTQRLMLYLNRERANNFSQSKDHKYNDTVMASMHKFVENTANQLFNMIHRLNSTQHHMSQRQQNQQGNLDHISLDLEGVKDEMATYSQKLTDTARNVEHLKDYNLHGRREREKLRRKMVKLAKELRQLLQHLGLGSDRSIAPKGQTWVQASSGPPQHRSTGSPTWARRTTAARKLGHVTPTTHDTSIPATRSVHVTPPPVREVNQVVTEPADADFNGVHPSDNEVLREGGNSNSATPSSKPPTVTSKYRSLLSTLIYIYI